MRESGDRTAARLTVARMRALAARRRSSRRVYLVAPALWKSVRTTAHAQAADWSTAVSAPPCIWVGARPRPDSAPTLGVPLLRWRALCAWIEARRLYLRPRLLVARRGMLRAGQAAADRLRSLRWPAWRAGALRHAFVAALLCIGCAAVAAVLLTRQAPLPLPLPALRTAAMIARLLPAAVPVVMVPPSPAAPLLPAPAVPVAAPSPDPSLAVLAEAGSMNLLTQAAEPDLDITSARSLWAQVGRQAGVDPLLLYSIALVESRSLHPDGSVGPTPWLFRVNDHLVYGSRHHVQMKLAMASQFGAPVQDVGLMQVYYPMHRDAVPDPLALLDPRTNITVAAKILRDGMHETRDPVLGVGYYHSHTPELARNYGTAVMTVYRRLKHIYPAAASPRMEAR